MEFSIIIPTHNRPDLLKLAIESVVGQTFPSFEIIIVNDGSDPQFTAAYQNLEAAFLGRIRVLHLERSFSGGHGPRYAINMGVNIAKGKYLAFLDDDDFWIDPTHLETAFAHLKDAGADVYFTDQQVFEQGQPTGKKIWLAGLEEKLPDAHPQTAQGSYVVTVTELMRQPGFAHLNTTILSADLYRAVNGMDENIRYEGDRDFYLRVVDNARLILYNPKETSRHNVPDCKKKDNVSTLSSNLQKLLFRLSYLEKAIMFARHPAIVRHAKLHKAYTLKSIAETLASQGNHAAACYYAQEGLATGFTFKWLFYIFYLIISRYFPGIAKFYNPLPSKG